MTTKHLLAIVLLATSLTGCCTVFNGGPKTVHIKSKVPRAVTVVDRHKGSERPLVFSGTAPCDVVLKRGPDKEYYVVWAGGEKQLSGDFFNVNGGYYANLPFGFIGLAGVVIDGVNGNLYGIRGECDMDDKKYTIPLKKTEQKAVLK